MSTQKVFYFLHIPKTAGATFNFSVLPKFFRAEEICPAYAYQQLMRIPLADLSRYRLYRGHFYYFLYRLLPDRPIYMTFLRDPVERVLSLYDYVRRDPTHYLHDVVQSLKGGIRDFVQCRELLVPNFQVTAIACDIDPSKTVANEQSRRSGEINEDTAIIDEMMRQPATREDLIVARERLESFPFVGITEHFGKSVQLLCHTFGWSAAPIYESLNVAPGTRVRRDQLAPDVLEHIIRTHQLDMELYEFAKSLFFKRVALMDSSKMKVDATVQEQGTRRGN